MLILSHFFKTNIVTFRTDQFTVRSSRGGGGNAGPPTICGVNTGEHSKIHVAVITCTQNTVRIKIKICYHTEYIILFTLVYADMNGNNCNSLDFQLGGTGIGATLANKAWSIKVNMGFKAALWIMRAYYNFIFSCQ